MSAKRYDSRVVARAKVLVDSGWSAKRTAEFIELEFGSKPTITTVRLWTDEAYAEDWRRRNRQSTRRGWQKANKHAPERISPERALERIKLMREHGVSVKAISVVARLWWGQEMTPAEVEGALKGQGMLVRRAERGDFLRAGERVS
jgi:hypothetical protein